MAVADSVFTLALRPDVRFMADELDRVTEALRYVLWSPWWAEEQGHRAPFHPPSEEDARRAWNLTPADPCSACGHPFGQHDHADTLYARDARCRGCWPGWCS